MHLAFLHLSLQESNKNNISRVKVKPAIYAHHFEFIHAYYMIANMCFAFCFLILRLKLYWTKNNRFAVKPFFSASFFKIQKSNSSFIYLATEHFKGSVKHPLS